MYLQRSNITILQEHLLTINTLMKASCCLQFIRACFMTSKEGCRGVGWGDSIVWSKTPVYTASEIKTCQVLGVHNIPVNSYANFKVPDSASSAAWLVTWRASRSIMGTATNVYRVLHGQMVCLLITLHYYLHVCIS